MEINMNPDVRVYWTATALYGLAALFTSWLLLRKRRNLPT